jgi:hypothetical protein
MVNKFIPTIICVFVSAMSGVVFGQSQAEDAKLLRDMAKKYQSAWDKASQEPDAFIAIVREHAGDVVIMKNIVGRYKSEIESKSDLGKSIQSAAKGATVGISAFTDGAQDFAKTFQERFRDLIQRAKSDAASAESEKTPGYYDSALRQLATAEWMLTILVAFNGEKDPTAIMLGEQLAKLTEEYKTSHAKLVRETQRTAKAPEERYQGTDLEVLRRDVTAAWKKKYPNDKLLAVVFDQAEWKINRLSRWNSATKSWDHVDKSALELTVIVERDSNSALLHAAFVNKDNPTGNISYGIDTKGSAFVTDTIDRRSLGK